MPWRLVYSRRATRDLDELPAGDRTAMHDRLGQFVRDPGSVDVTKLGGSGNQWRLRSGRWRAIFELDTRTGVVTILRILARNEGTYRRR
jgi:mRNA-degrading endonuclease RelE of RelBE toxin-antitoxin system